MKYKFRDLELYKEDDKYFLSATYDYEDEDGFYKITFPKILLNIDNDFVFFADYNRYKVNIGFGDLPCIPDSNKEIIKKRLIRKKPKKMTLAEIEKVLGYPVEIKE